MLIDDRQQDLDNLSDRQSIRIDHRVADEPVERGSSRKLVVEEPLQVVRVDRAVRLPVEPSSKSRRFDTKPDGTYLGVAQSLSARAVLDHARRPADHPGGGGSERSEEVLRLERVKHDDAIAIPQLAWSETRLRREPAVVVVEADPESARELRTDSRLPRAHEAKQSDVAAEWFCRLGGRWNV
jgi:hypothetical protein